MLLFLLCVGAGLAGDGPLSEVSVQSTNGSFSVQFSRFLRQGKKEQIVILIEKAYAHDIEVIISDNLVEEISLEDVIPRPHEFRATLKDHVMVFQVTENAPAQILIRGQPMTAGSIRGTIRVGADSVDINQLVYP